MKAAVHTSQRTPRLATACLAGCSAWRTTVHHLPLVVHAVVGDVQEVVFSPQPCLHREMGGLHLVIGVATVGPSTAGSPDGLVHEQHHLIRHDDVLRRSVLLQDASITLMQCIGIRQSVRRLYNAPFGTRARMMRLASSLRSLGCPNGLHNLMTLHMQLRRSTRGELRIGIPVAPQARRLHDSAVRIRLLSRQAS
jgi:hypothetical protein